MTAVSVEVVTNQPLANISHAVVIQIELVSVFELRAVVTHIPHAIEVKVRLVGGRCLWAIVVLIDDTVTV